MDLALLIEWAIKSIILIFIIIGGFAYLTLFERRTLARIQMRIGPNRAGPWGILQPVADGIKLIFKEELIPDRADKAVFLIAGLIGLGIWIVNRFRNLSKTLSEEVS